MNLSNHGKRNIVIRRKIISGKIAENARREKLPGRFLRADERNLHVLAAVGASGGDDHGAAHYTLGDCCHH
jgi:hypothetical protein